MANPMGPGQNQQQMMSGQGVPQQLPQMGRNQRPPMLRNQLYVPSQSALLTPNSKMGYSPAAHPDKKPHSGSNSHGHPTPLMVQQNAPNQFKMPNTGMMQGPKPQPGQMGQPGQQQPGQQQQTQQQLLQPNGHLDVSQNSPSVNGAQNPNGTSAPTSGGPGSQAVATKNNGATLAAQNEINAKIFKRNLGNAGVMRILDLIDNVSNEPHEKLSTLEFWTRFVQSYFAPNAVMQFTPAVISATNGDGHADSFLHNGPSRLYELDVLTAPRFLVASILSQNLTEHQVSLPGIKSQVMNNGSVLIASRLNIQFIYADGSIGSVQGTCRISLNKDYRIDWIDCRCMSYQSSITINSLEKQWLQHQTSDDKLDALGANGKNTFIDRLRESAQSVKTSSNSGIHDTAMRILQIGDLMTYLKPLMSFSLTNGINLPVKALEGYMTASSGAHIHRLSAASTVNGAASSPSPLTTAQDEPKNILKKRRLSGSVVNSPLNPDNRRN